MNVLVANVNTQRLDAKLLSCIAAVALETALQKPSTGYEMVSWESARCIKDYIDLFNLTCTETRKVSFLSAAAAISFYFCLPSTAMFYDSQRVRGGLCVSESNIVASLKQAAVTSLFLSSPLQSVTNVKK